MEKPSTAQCCIDRCLTKTKSVKVKDIIYYLYPSDGQWAAAWEKRITEYDSHYRRKPGDLLCSLHFAKASMDPVSRQLNDHALPVYFPRFGDMPHQQRLLPLKLATVTATDGSKLAKPPGTCCCINGCQTQFDKSDPKIPGFKFPEDAEKRKLWIWLIDTHTNQKIDWEESMKICALHFSDSSFTQPDQLTEDAKPSLFKAAATLRKSELEKQQSQAKNHQQQPNTMKISSINVPLHRANAENQSMIRRSAPIIARRLSLPYSRLPKLLPKPSIAKRVPSTQINGPNGLMNVHRIGSQNIVLSSASPSASKQTLRPVPGLNKVVSPSNVVITNGQQNVTRPNMVLIRKSMRPQSPSPSSTQPSPQSTNTLKTVRVSSATGWVPIKQTQITRMPPRLTPAPHGIKLQSFKTYSKSRDGLPVISQVQSIVPSEQNKLNRTTSSLVKCANSAITSSPPVQNVLRLKPTVNDDVDPEFIRAINECKCSQPMETNEIAATAAGTSMNTNGNRMKNYVVKDELSYVYPKMLLERILDRKRQNSKLEIELNELKKELNKFHKERLDRRMKKAKVTEIIELS